MMRRQSCRGPSRIIFFRAIGAKSYCLLFAGKQCCSIICLPRGCYHGNRVAPWPSDRRLSPRSSVTNFILVCLGVKRSPRKHRENIGLGYLWLVMDIWIYVCCNWKISYQCCSSEKHNTKYYYYY